MDNNTIGMNEKVEEKQAKGKFIIQAKKIENAQIRANSLTALKLESFMKLWYSGIIEDILEANDPNMSSNVLSAAVLINEFVKDDEYTRRRGKSKGDEVMLNYLKKLTHAMSTADTNQKSNNLLALFHFAFASKDLRNLLMYGEKIVTAKTDEISNDVLILLLNNKLSELDIEEQKSLVNGVLEGKEKIKIRKQ